jgi:hypothetical protein
MRLSEWRAEAPARDALGARVTEIVAPVMRALTDDPDPECWIVWGDDPSIRYTILAPTQAGLVTCFVRVNVPGEGPRASAKLVRWNRVQVGELAIETQSGHRLVSFQVETSVLRGADDTADRVGAFAKRLFDAIDGRPWSPATPAATAAPPARRGARSASKG